MRKSKIRNTYVILLVLLAVSLTLEVFIPVSAVRAETSEKSPVFSIIWITDTQYLSENYPASYDSLCSWIVNNNETCNVKMVVHTGDIVDTEDDPTQWTNANQSMSILLNNNIPYCWDAGNHDYDATCWIGNQYVAFDTTLMQEKSYWVSSIYNGTSTAVHFNVSGWDCLIINIAYHANSTVLNWAENLLDAYPNSHVIVATHAYIDLKCHYDSWATSLKTMMDKHANVFLTLNGHYHSPTVSTSSNWTESGDRYELMFDMQGVDEELGAASARILTFDVTKGTVFVQTYAVYANQFLSDSNNNFTLNTTFHNDAVDFFVAPEYTYGILLSIVACFAAFVAYAAFKAGTGISHFGKHIKCSI